MAAPFVVIKQRKERANDGGAEETKETALDDASLGEEAGRLSPEEIEEEEFKLELQKELGVQHDTVKPDPDEPRFKTGGEDYDEALRGYISDQDFAGEVAESPIGFVMNFLAIAFLLTCFSNSGVYAFLGRSEAASNSVKR